MLALNESPKRLASERHRVRCKRELGGPHTTHSCYGEGICCQSTG